jgi:hypothetical protein
MRRQLAIAALCAAVLSTLLAAQMHGGSSGSRGSAPAGHSSFSSAGGFRGGSGFSGAPRVGLQSGPHFRTTFNTGFRRPFGPGRFPRRVFFRTFAPYYFGYYGYPYDWDSYASSDSYPAYDYYSGNPLADDVTAQQQDIDRLEEEVARLREERQAPDAAPTKAPAEVASTPTLLVFLDKHTQEVQNYAVVGGTLWIFGEQRATKLPLAWLDVDATIKANDERGVDFRLPN